MQNKFLTFILVVLIAVGFVGANVLYIVDETEQAVITQFGKAVGEPITEAGLYYKIPFVQTVNRFEKRILQWDGDSKPIPTLEKQSIQLDATARWRIADALKFMQTVGTESIAQTRLDAVIDAATRDAVSNAYLVQVVRNSNDIIHRTKLLKQKGNEVILTTELKEIDIGREEITRKILKRASEIMPNLGVELIDVRIKRINYVDEVRKTVYERMISERQQAAERYRSEGLGKKAEIDGQMQRELERIQSEAYKKAQEIKGRADAEAIEIYAEAYNKDPEFYSFVQTLETYRETLDANTTLMLDIDNDFFHYFKTIDAQ